MLTTLTTIYNLHNEHGFYYHFVDMNTGERQWDCEISSIDTALLLCGVLTARQYFSSNSTIVGLATSIYERVDWPWMQNGQLSFSMGWKPESGFLEARWNTYCELMMIYLLAIGSPTHPVPAETWDAFTRPSITYAGFTYVDANAPLFTHQYSQAYFDFQHKKDAYADYFDSSVQATKAHRQFCIDQKFEYTEELWGISASDYEFGYTAWGGPPKMGPIDGSYVPCAAAGSIPFLHQGIDVLMNFKSQFPQSYGRYSFVDAFNPISGWTDSDSLGIDLGISMIQAENYRSGNVIKWFMENHEAHSAMLAVGFKSDRKLEWWAILIIVIAVVAIVVLCVFYVKVNCQKKAEANKVEKTEVEQMIDTKDAGKV